MNSEIRRVGMPIMKTGVKGFDCREKNKKHRRYYQNGTTILMIRWARDVPLKGRKNEKES